MEKIAFIGGNQAYSWAPLVLALAAVGTALLFLGLYSKTREQALAAFTTAPLAMLLGFVFSRLLHYYCFSETYEGLRQAMTDFGTGGFGLPGVFLGCLVAAGITRLVGIHRDLPGMLDAMSLAGAAGLAVGRLSAFFNTSDRGQILTSIRSMPWAYPVTNAVSGATEYRLATFLLQSLVAAALAVGLGLFHQKCRKKGDTVLIFLLLYCASQIVLDSTRYDSLYFRWNGFVSIVQVLGALTVAGVILIFSRRAVKAGASRGLLGGIWAGLVAALACAGYMEYFVQRHGSRALVAYGVMSACLAAVSGLTLLLRALGLRKGSTSD